MLRGTGVAGTASITGGSITGVTGSAYVLAQSNTAVSCPADTNEDTLATITIPANAMGPQGKVRLRTYWSYTNSANNKTFRIRYSGGAGTVLFTSTRTTSLTNDIQIELMNLGATNSQQTSAAIEITGAAITFAAPVTGLAVDTTAATTIVITGQKATAGETLTLTGYTAELVRP
jgi:archaellum component FlaF (FlaF/FlaG flagellin family)